MSAIRVFVSIRAKIHVCFSIRTYFLYFTLISDYLFYILFYLNNNFAFFYYYFLHIERKN